MGIRTKIKQEDEPPDLLKGKKSTISLINYYPGKGSALRDSGPSFLLGYCATSPREVLKRVFPEFYVTRYNGYELFDPNDPDKEIPLCGLGIAPVGYLAYGLKCTGRLDTILQLEQISLVKRKNPAAPKEIEKIFEYLGKLGDYDADFPIHKHQRENILGIIKGLDFSSKFL
jgi:hypothetical protein